MPITAAVSSPGLPVKLTLVPTKYAKTAFEQSKHYTVGSLADIWKDIVVPSRPLKNPLRKPVKKRPASWRRSDKPAISNKPAIKVHRMYPWWAFLTDLLANLLGN